MKNMSAAAVLCVVLLQGCAQNAPVLSKEEASKKALVTTHNNLHDRQGNRGYGIYITKVDGKPADTQKAVWVSPGTHTFTLTNTLWTHNINVTFMAQAGNEYQYTALDHVYLPTTPFPMVGASIESHGESIEYITVFKQGDDRRVVDVLVTDRTELPNKTFLSSNDGHAGGRNRFIVDYARKVEK